MRRRIAPALLALGPLLALAAPPPTSTTSLDADAAARFAALALKCLHQEYPNHISHTLGGEGGGRAGAAPAAAGVLRLLRRALRCARPLAAGAADASVPRRAVRCCGARRSFTQPHCAQHLRRSRLPARRGPRILRAPLRARVAAAGGGGAARLG